MMYRRFFLAVAIVFGLFSSVCAATETEHVVVELSAPVVSGLVQAAAPSESVQVAIACIDDKALDAAQSDAKRVIEEFKTRRYYVGTAAGALTIVGAYGVYSYFSKLFNPPVEIAQLQMLFNQVNDKCNALATQISPEQRSKALENLQESWSSWLSRKAQSAAGFGLYSIPSIIVAETVRRVAATKGIETLDAYFSLRDFFSDCPSLRWYVETRTNLLTTIRFMLAGAVLTEERFVQGLKLLAPDVTAFAGYIREYAALMKKSGRSFQADWFVDRSNDLVAATNQLIENYRDLDIRGRLEVIGNIHLQVQSLVVDLK